LKALLIINLFGEEIAVRARVHTINGFSAHADQRELVAWHQSVADVETTFLVHGKEPVMAALAPHLAGHIEMPALHQMFQL
jgi:metallo-beta-lactamase family protein